MSTVEKGQTFDSADSAISFVEAFAKQHFHSLRKRHCISVENYNKRVTNKSALPLRLKFYNIQWECKHAGKTEAGHRSRVKKLGCPVEIGACYDRNLQKFAIVRVNLNHNHRLEDRKGSAEDNFDHIEAVDECEIEPSIVKSQQCPKLSKKRKAASPVKSSARKTRKVKTRYEDDDAILKDSEEEIQVIQLRHRDEKNVSTKRPYRRRKNAQVDTSNETIPVQIELSIVPLEKEILSGDVINEMETLNLGNTEREEFSFKSEETVSVNEDNLKAPSISGDYNILMENRTGDAVETDDNSSTTPVEYSEELSRHFFEDRMPDSGLNAVAQEKLHEEANYEETYSLNERPLYTNDPQLENFLLNYDYSLESKIFGGFDMSDVSPSINSDDSCVDLFPELESILTEFEEKLKWSCGRENRDNNPHSNESVSIPDSDELRIFREEINSIFQGMEVYDNLMELFGRIHSENPITREEFDSEFSKILASKLECIES